MLELKILRVIDANFNRLKEGLRVSEDISRFIIEDDRLRKKIRQLRHKLDVIAHAKVIKKAIAQRNCQADLGRHLDILELSRRNYHEVLCVNIQRAKESLRVLEEFFKLISSQKCGVFKKLRYEVYALEKEIYSRMKSHARKNI
jgi:thiamine-phosphate pyrophosphorylase